MQRGFVTIATGDERYYILARNLLRSYRQNTATPMRFAVIADRHNQYTEEFDNAVILDNPTNSWMDKLTLLTSCPYDENLFLDADCLVYRDINFSGNCMQGQMTFHVLERHCRWNRRSAGLQRRRQKSIQSTSNGTYDITPCPHRNTDALLRYGLRQDDSRQILNGNICILPSIYLCPRAYFTGIRTRSRKTISIHWFSSGWQTGQEKMTWKKPEKKFASAA